ncbi:MAG: hypothetical protein Q8P42_09465 [Gallionella sp.]|nr:hypothetical protein [Gallionella sp.]
MVDATFVEVPRQRNKWEENALIKEGAIHIGWGKGGGIKLTNFSKIKNGLEIPVKNWETEKLA